MIRQRIEWVDYAKAAAIFLVVLLHVHCNVSVDQLINGFIMPAFFIISGYLFSYERNPSPRMFAKKRFRQIIVPYLWINAVAYLCWLIVLRRYGDDAGSAAAWHEPLVNILAGYPAKYPHDTPLWSLLSFFVVEMAYYPIGRIVKSPWLTACVFLAIAYLLKAIGIDGASLPLAIGPSICGIAFYAAGNGLRRFDFKSVSNAVCIAVAIVSLTSLVASTCSNGMASFYICRYGNFVLFLCSSLSGCALVIAVSILVSRMVKESAIIRLISNGTLIICGFHLLCFAVIKGVMLSCFGIEPRELASGLWRGLAFAVAAFAMTLPVAYAVRRYLKPIVGK